jgi:phosphoglycolate phosphatase
MCKLVIFDLDGTLYKTELTLFPAVQKAAEELNLPVPGEAEMSALIGNTMDEFCRNMFPGASSDEIIRFREKVRYHERRAIPVSGQLYDGVAKMLEELRAAGFTLAVCSHASEKYIDIILTSFDMKKLFSYILPLDVTKEKLVLIKELLVETGAIFGLVVGDRHFDFSAAKDNNLPSIGCSYGYGGDEVGQADFTVEEPQEIPGVIFQCEIFERIRADLSKIKRDWPVVVGINGIDASGKTSFAVNLAKYLRSRGHKTECVHLDDFHNPRDIRYQLEDEIESYLKYAFNLKGLEEEPLAPIKEGGKINKELALLDLKTDTFASHKEYRIDRETIVIVEGVLLYREPVDKYFDYRVFLDISFEELLRRVAERDVPLYGKEFLERYHRKYIPIQKRYLESCRPVERCDLIIDNNDFTRPVVR